MNRLRRGKYYVLRAIVAIVCLAPAVCAQTYLITRLAGKPASESLEGPATKARLVAVLDMAVDGAGNLYLSEQLRVRRVSADGTIHVFRST